jgi:hypothetical protein
MQPNNNIIDPSTCSPIISRGAAAAARPTDDQIISSASTYTLVPKLPLNIASKPLFMSSVKRQRIHQEDNNIHELLPL